MARLTHSSPLLVTVKSRSHNQYITTADYKCLSLNVETSVILLREKNPVSCINLFFSWFFEYLAFEELSVEGSMSYIMTLSSVFGNFSFIRKGNAREVCLQHHPYSVHFDNV